MGRKKVGAFSRDQILKTIGDDKDPKDLSKKVSTKIKSKRSTKRVEKIDVEDEDTCGNLKMGESEEEEDMEEVFDENLDDFCDDMDELTRLMSVVEIANDPEELERQINLAAFHQFLICLPPCFHPAIKGHLTERFKSFVTFPTNQSLENHPAVTPEVVQEKLDSLSEKAGISFSLSLAPPTYHCLKCEQALHPQLGLETNVMVFDIGGPRIATKYRYRFLLHLVFPSLVC